MNEIKSTLDLAYEYLQKSSSERKFSEIWDYVCSQLNEDEKNDVERISKFFTNLSLDGRFVFLKNNSWNLRDRVEFKAYGDYNTNDDYYTGESDDATDDIDGNDDEDESGSRQDESIEENL